MQYKLCLNFRACREEKPGFFARLRKKKNATNEEAGRASQQVDPSTFPEVKSRKTSLPPLYPTKDCAQEAMVNSSAPPPGQGPGRGGHGQLCRSSTRPRTRPRRRATTPWWRRRAVGGRRADVASARIRTRLMKDGQHHRELLTQSLILSGTRDECRAGDQGQGSTEEKHTTLRRGFGGG